MSIIHVPGFLLHLQVVILVVHLVLQEVKVYQKIGTNPDQTNLNRKLNVPDYDDDTWPNFLFEYGSGNHHFTMQKLVQDI